MIEEAEIAEKSDGVYFEFEIEVGEEEYEVENDPKGNLPKKIEEEEDDNNG